MMIETALLIHDAAHRLFVQHVTPELLLRAEQGEWSAKLWEAVEEAGFLDTLADEDATPDWLVFGAMIRNRYTRAAYLNAVRQFLAWVESRGVALERITPGMVGAYFDQHSGSLGFVCSQSLGSGHFI